MPLNVTTQPPGPSNPISVLPSFPNNPAGSVAVVGAAVPEISTQAALDYGHIWTTTTYLFHLECTVVGPLNGFLLILDAPAVPSTGAAVAPLIVRGISSNGDWGFAEIDRRERPIGPFANDVVAVFSVNANPFIYTPPATPSAFFSAQVV